MNIPQEFENLGKRDLIRIILNQKLRIEELEKRLLAYENAHTPPSKQNIPKYPKKESSGRPIGAPRGHKGTTRPYKEPDNIIDVKQDKCSRCFHLLGKPIKIEKKIIEDIPKPQPVIVTQFNVHSYLCTNCAEINTARHPDLPDKGRFGPNLQAEIALMRYEDRLPLRKIPDNLNRKHNLDLTPSSVLDITDRVSDKLQPNYQEIKQEVLTSTQVNADETSQSVQGKNFWIWVFATLNSVLFLIRPNRGKKTAEEALGKNYHGILGCDGWASYPKCAEKIQRCWAHLLREAKWLAEKHEGQARLMYKTLCRIFNRLKKITPNTVQGVRTRTYNWCTKQMKQEIKRCEAYAELRKFAVKIENGFEYWFTHIKHPEIDLTNNKAERALREMVVQRKISSLWNEKGVRIKETIMSVLATWKLRRLNPFDMLRETLSS